MNREITENSVIIKNTSQVQRIAQKIDLVFNFIKDTTKTYEALKEIRSPTIFVQGTNSYEVGNEFIIVFMNYYTVRAKVKEIQDDDEFYKKIIYYIHSEPTDQQFELIYECYSVTIDNSTLMKLTFVFEEEGLKMNPAHYDRLINERNNLMMIYTEYLDNYRINNVNQVESIFLEFSPGRVYDIISDWSLFKSYVPSLCENVETIEDSKNKFKVKWCNELGIEGVESELIITESYFKEDEAKFIHKLELINDYDIILIPNQEITFSIINICDDKCFIEFRHFIKDYVRMEYLISLSNIKQEILKEFKISLY